jgi:hypothetical protein
MRHKKRQRLKKSQEAMKYEDNMRSCNTFLLLEVVIEVLEKRIIHMAKITNFTELLSNTIFISPNHKEH